MAKRTYPTPSRSSVSITGVNPLCKSLSSDEGEREGTQCYYQFLCWVSSSLKQQEEAGVSLSIKLLRVAYALVLRVHSFWECLTSRGKLFCLRSLFSQSASDLPRFLRGGNNQAPKMNTTEFCIRMPVLKPEDVSLRAPGFTLHGARTHSASTHRKAFSNPFDFDLDTD